MSEDSIARVRYFQQQFLRTKDFSDEQAYHVEMRRRHNIAHHTWGIVNGLNIKHSNSELFADKGFAIDGYGRELVLSHRIKIEFDEFNIKNNDKLDIWLIYNRAGTDMPPSGFARCNKDKAESYYRWQEAPQLRIENHEPGLNPRKPRSVAQADLDFSADRSPPDEPKQDWPVFLGTIIRDRSQGDKPTYSIDNTKRPSAGLVGERILSPSERTSISIDSLQSEGPQSQITNSSKFSVALKNDCDIWKKRLTISDEGEIDLNGNTTLEGNLTIKGGAIDFSAIGTSIEGDEPALAKPWRIYKHIRKIDPPLSNLPSEAVDINVEQLRIEIAESGTDNSQVVVGAWSSDEEAFKPILTVGSVSDVETGGNYSVVVHSDLIVKGSITKEETINSRRLSPAAKDYLLGTYSAGLSGANAQLPKFYDSQFDKTECNVEDGPGRKKIIDELIDTDVDVTERLRPFIEELIVNPQVRSEIVRALKVSGPATRISGVINELLFDEDIGSDVREAVVTPILDNPSVSQEITERYIEKDAGSLTIAINKAIEVDDDRVAELLMDSANGPELVGIELKNNPARIQVVLDKVFESNIARNQLFADAIPPQEIEDYFSEDKSRLGVLLSDTIEDNILREELIELIYQKNNGTKEIAEFLRDNAAEIAQGSTGESRLKVVIDTLLHNVGAGDVRAAVIKIIMDFGKDTADEIGQYLAANTQDIDPDLSPATSTTRLEAILNPVIDLPTHIGNKNLDVTKVLLKHPDGPTEIGKYLSENREAIDLDPTNNNTKLESILNPLISHSTDPNDDVTRVLLKHTDGPTEVGEFLANNPFDISDPSSVNRLGTILSLVLDNSIAQEDVATAVLEHPQGSAEIGKYIKDNPQDTTVQDSDNRLKIILDEALSESANHSNIANIIVNDLALTVDAPTAGTHIAQFKLALDGHAKNTEFNSALCPIQ